MPQIEHYDPPPNPAKITDSRATSYIAEFGNESWELDALGDRRPCSGSKTAIVQLLPYGDGERAVVGSRKTMPPARDKNTRSVLNQHEMKTASRIAGSVVGILLVVVLIWQLGFRRPPSRVSLSQGSTTESNRTNDETVVVAPALTVSERQDMPPREEIVGIGAVLKFDKQFGAPRIANVLPNSPAAQAGLTPGLVVHKIDDALTEGMKLQECVARLRGILGTKVILELVDPEQNHTNSVELTRQQVKI